MSTATPPKPLTDPVLTTARMQADAQHPKGFIRTTKKDSKGNDIKSVGYVTGSNLQLGLAIEVQKDDKKKTWAGTITSGPGGGGAGQHEWTFQVVNKKNESKSDLEEPEPFVDETVTVTVTDADGPTSPPVPANPQPDVIP